MHEKNKVNFLIPRWIKALLEREEEICAKKPGEIVAALIYDFSRKVAGKYLRKFRRT